MGDKPMKQVSWKGVIDFVGMVSIVASLFIVAYQLRQSTALAMAQATFDLNTALDEPYRTRAQDATLDELVDKGHHDPDSLSERQQSQFDAWLRADMNLFEAAWFYYTNGFIKTTDSAGWRTSICSRVSTAGGKRFWEREAMYFSESFRTTIKGWCF
jgi:hypothetical protein